MDEITFLFFGTQFMEILDTLITKVSASKILNLKHLNILDTFRFILEPSINQFSGPAYLWGVAGAAARVESFKHLDPLQQRTDALLGCQGKTN